MNTNQTFQFIESYNNWQLQLITLNIRGLILTTKNALESLNCSKSSDNKNKLPDFDSTVIQPDESEKVENFLGGESQVIAFDTTSNFDPNLFAAITGSLIGGGVLVLMLTEKDLTNAALQSESFNEKINSDFKTKLCSKNKICPVLDRFLRFSINNASTAIFYDHYFHINHKLFKMSPNKTDFIQQQALIEKIKHVSNGHANRPLVLTANRGRGKSAALGIAAAHLANTRPLTIIISAPKIKNLNSFYKHFEQTIKQIDESNYSSINFSQLTNIRLTNDSLIKFMPVDQIIKMTPFANLVIVDEAAAIPVFQLEKISQNYNRLIFSTTTDGYEGNGKGFEIRFKKHLIETKNTIVTTTLTQPIRWSIDDEVERSCFRALLLESKIDMIDLSKIPRNLTNHLSFELISKEALKENNIQLQFIFSLLINAHYQTRPSDLKTILTDDNTKVFVTKWQDKIIGVCLVKQEGQLDEITCNQICNAEKRLKGELLPQTIMANFGLEEAGNKTYFRIMRIVIHPQMQNRSIGSFLLESLSIYAKKDNIDFLGSSFSATPEVAKFWIKNNYHCIRFGTSKDSSSGNHCLEILKPLNDNNKKMFNFLVNRFNKSFLYKIHGELFDLELTVISIIILEHLSYQSILLDQFEIGELVKFTEGKKSFSAIDDLLIKLILLKRKNIKLSSGWKSEHILFLIAAIFKQINMKELAVLFKLNGKKESLCLLRELTKKCLMG